MGSRFPGLDTLRGFAALFVLLSHLRRSLLRYDLPAPVGLTIFDRGSEAVSFFFVLSGFLITYLLYVEHQRTATVNVFAFYMRRVLRIWPLYFGVVGLGLILNLYASELGFPHRPNYPASAALLYVFFLPFVMNALYSIGTILAPAWSIGVEEQFYLVWAPLVKRWRRHLASISAVVFVLSLSIHIYITTHNIKLPGMKIFYLLPRFHFLTAGALAAWAVFHYRERLLATPLFRWRAVQIFLWMVVADLWLVDYFETTSWQEEILQSILHPWLIVETAVNSRSLLQIGSRATDWLGDISYSLYMLHPIGILVVVRLFLRQGDWSGSEVLFFTLIIPAVLLVCLGLAKLSFHFLESPILRLKDRFTPVSP